MKWLRQNPLVNFWWSRLSLACGCIS